MQHQMSIIDLRKEQNHRPGYPVMNKALEIRKPPESVTAEADCPMVGVMTIAGQFIAHLRGRSITRNQTHAKRPEKKMFVMAITK
jgi:hypothetical protein